jgi:hypothetical protein
VGIIDEEFVRCVCGNPDFEAKRIVVIRKPKKSEKGAEDIEPFIMEEKTKAFCTHCNRPLVL